MRFVFSGFFRMWSIIRRVFSISQNQFSSAVANVLLVLCLKHLSSASSDICVLFWPLRPLSIFRVHTSLYAEKSLFLFIHNFPSICILWHIFKESDSLWLI